ncbi:MAG: sensor histidine kinase [Chloroflexaceae bacterium]|nr:sensor histidine kinase [Chloroflexaceae bacterium]
MIEHSRLARRAHEAAVLEERNRLARELHDSVSQQLFSMMLTAQAARAHIEKNPQRTLTQLERLQETAAAALAEMRALIAQLRPPAVSDQGLGTALQRHVAQVSRREGLRIDFSITGDERVAHGLEQALYRIVQEALNNIVKHAQASRAFVALDCQPHLVQLRVADNGQGFDVALLHDVAARDGDRRHFGLLTMEERATEMGGALSVLSVPGAGTEIVVQVPRPTR